MRQQPDPGPYEDENLEVLGTPVYEGSGLSVRALTAEELQRFLDAHHGQPARRLGSGWTALDPPPGHPLGVPRTLPPAELEPPRPPPLPAAELDAGGFGRPGRSALAQYRRRRAEELAAWARSLAWRVPLVAAASLTAAQLILQAGLARVLATLAGVAVAGLVGWRLRFKPSKQAHAWQRGANREQQTARLVRVTGAGCIPPVAANPATGSCSHRSRRVTPDAAACRRCVRSLDGMPDGRSGNFRQYQCPFPLGLSEWPCRPDTEPSHARFETAVVSDAALPGHCVRLPVRQGGHDRGVRAGRPPSACGRRAVLVRTPSRP
jgi:hypothetical protein